MDDEDCPVGVDEDCPVGDRVGSVTETPSEERKDTESSYIKIKIDFCEKKLIKTAALMTNKTSMSTTITYFLITHFVFTLSSVTSRRRLHARFRR